MNRFLLVFIVVFGVSAQARVFNFQSETFATYFGGGFGDATLLEGKAFTESSGASTEFSSSDVVPFTQTIELGFITNIRNRVTMKVAAQVVQARQVEAEGNNSSGQKLLDVTSDLFVFNPSVVFQYNLGGGDMSKWYVFGGIGWSSLSMDNAYTMTATGQSTYSGIPATFTEKVESTFFTYELGAGYEIHALDTTTFTLDLGYRFMEGLDLRYKGDGYNLAEGDLTHSSGDRVKINGGASNRQVNLGGFYIGIGFRFYIDLG
tara:strand:- start:78506 stop:79291 length:786 start_codon:yes stop_codon:yes gene_type:complete